MFNNTVDDISLVSGYAELAPIVLRNNSNKDTGPVSFNVSFINHLGYPVTVVNRQGFRHTVPISDSSSKESVFRVRLQISVTGGGWQTLKVFLASLPEGKYKIMHEIKAVWEKHTSMRHRNGTIPFIAFYIDYVIEPKAFFDRSSVYHRDSDLVLSRLDILAAPPHPYNPDAAMLDRKAFDPESMSASNACIQFELIENPDHPMTPRYVAISNKAFKIAPKSDNRRQPGLYVTYQSRDPENHSRTRAIQEVYDFEQMEKELGIYKTAEEALSAGDLKSVRQAQLSDLEHQTALLRRELEGYKAIVEQSKAERDEEFRSIEHVRRQEVAASELALSKQIAETKVVTETADQLRMELKSRMEQLENERSQRTALFRENMAIRDLIRKDHYDATSFQRKDVFDERSTIRKDYSDVLKFLPVAVIGIGALVTAVMKFKSA